MHAKDTAVDELALYFSEPSNYSHASNLVSLLSDAEADDALYVVTDQGRRYLATLAATEAGPSVAQVVS